MELVIWVLTLVAVMPDGTISEGILAKDSQKTCLADMAEINESVARAKKDGKVMGWSAKCDSYTIYVK